MVMWSVAIIAYVAGMFVMRYIVSLLHWFPHVFSRHFKKSDDLEYFVYCVVWPFFSVFVFCVIAFSLLLQLWHRVIARTAAHGEALRCRFGSREKEKE